MRCCAVMERLRSLAVSLLQHSRPCDAIRFFSCFGAATLALHRHRRMAKNQAVCAAKKCRRSVAVRLDIPPAVQVMHSTRSLSATDFACDLTHYKNVLNGGVPDADRARCA